MLKNVSKAHLYVVATPIGNDDDLTPRALEVLRDVDVVFAEDTRRFGLRSKAWGLSRSAFALHEHNESKQAGAVVDLLAQGQSVALVSDAGTPLISDPGYVIVRAAHQAGYPVVPLPGASSIIAALSAAGIASDRFFFEGFLPAKSAARRTRLKALRGLGATLVLLESPRRVLSTLEDIKAVMGEVEVGFCRELSKTHETIILDSIDGLIQKVSTDAEQQLGEIVLLLRAPKQVQALDAQWAGVAEDLLALMPPRQVAKLLAKWSGQNARDIYASFR